MARNAELIRLERALPKTCRLFLDRLPTMVKAKATRRKRHDERKAREFLARAADAALNRRRALMTYFSSSSRRAKEYTIEPIRLAYADGGIYLTAWVPKYCEMRTFALERIRTLQLLDERFEPRSLPIEPFANSLGVHSGTPERIEIEFDARAADYVREREWHRSMSIEELPDGSLLARLTVCDDKPLRRWIHSFGPMARVVAPARLSQAIFEEIEEARERYKPRLTFDVPRKTLPPADQPKLPVKYRGWKAS